MRHAIGILLIVGAILAAGAGWGPLFLGAPVVGVALLLTALGLEVWVWRNFFRKEH
ncbi:MAG TPA: glycosyl transferase family 39 [Gammaproteobacteria bacterium]|nr:glycosyl transferase family 39 [Gammaproteobacteria bacterium]